MNKSFHRIFIMMFLSAVVLSLGACNTMSGLGKDVTEAGDEITEEADEHND